MFISIQCHIALLTLSKAVLLASSFLCHLVMYRYASQRLDGKLGLVRLSYSLRGRLSREIKIKIHYATYRIRKPEAENCGNGWIDVPYRSVFAGR